MSKPAWINTYHGIYNRSARNGAYKYIVVHYTGAQTPAAGNAKNNCIYFSGGNRNASAHYFIDNAGVWEYLDPDSWCAWHVGDGGGRYGITNSNGIGIEVCQQGDFPFTEDEIQHLTRLVGYLQDKYNIPDERIKMHNHASGKLCPLYYSLRPSEWSRLHARITSGEQEDELPSPKDVVNELMDWDIKGPNGTDVKFWARTADMSDTVYNLANEPFTFSDTDEDAKTLLQWIYWTAKNTTQLKQEIADLSERLDRVLEAVAD